MKMVKDGQQWSTTMVNFQQWPIVNSGQQGIEIVYEYVNIADINIACYMEQYIGAFDFQMWTVSWTKICDTFTNFTSDSLYNIVPLNILSKN